MYLFNNLESQMCLHCAYTIMCHNVFNLIYRELTIRDIWENKRMLIEACAHSPGLLLWQWKYHQVEMRGVLFMFHLFHSSFINKQCWMLDPREYAIYYLLFFETNTLEIFHDVVYDKVKLRTRLQSQRMDSPASLLWPYLYFFLWCFHLCYIKLFP